jgi:hypothetical protein
MYYVVAANGSCKTTSDKFLYTGITELGNQLRIFQQLPDGSVIVESDAETISEINVYDVSGKQVLNLKKPQAANGVYIIDTRNLSPGVFIAHVNGKIPFRGKFIKGQ